jgi:tetratricopeptide (TPR) repeat protein
VLCKAAQTAVSGICRAAAMARSSACRRVALRVCAGVVLVLASAAMERGAAAQPASAQPVAAELSADTSGGFARIVFRFNGDVDANVRMSNGILVIGFSIPVDVSIDRLNPAAAGYVSAARRDPDGKGLRIALARRFTLHSMQANDRLFVDLMPDSWKGPPPPLPQEVVEELARKAKEAERRQRQIRQLELQKQMVTTRVRVAHQPNFSRYVFELPELVSVIAERNGEKLNLQLDAPLKFDLADAKATLPPTIEHIEAETGEQSTNIKFTFIGKVDIRSFREDNSYVIDVAANNPAYKRGDTAAPRAGADAPLPTGGTLSGLDVPLTVPAKDSAKDAGRNAPAAAKDAARNAARLGEPPAPAAPVPASQAAATIGMAPPNMVFDPAKQIEAANRSPARPAAGLPNEMMAPPSPGESALAERAASPPAPAAFLLPPPQAADGKAGGAPEGEVAEPRSQPQPQARASAQPTSPSASPSAPLASPPPAESPAAATLPAHADATGTVAVAVQRQSDNLRLVFPFAAPTSGAVFRRADTLWAVFDTATKIDIDALQKDPTRTIAAATVTTGPNYQVVRIKFERPRLTSFSTAEDSWTIAIGDTVLDPTMPLNVSRNVIGAVRPSAVVGFERPQAIHRIADPDAGDTLIVVTGFAPARGLLRDQDFVELRMLASTHGIVVQPFADDIEVELSGDKVVISRPAGLVLSAANQIARRNGYRSVILDPQAWGFDREADFTERQRNLITAAAEAPENKRLTPRLELARFYLAREMYEEAKGVLEVALGDDHPSGDDTSGLVMRAIAKIMMGRAEEGLTDLANPLIGDNHDAQLWRGLAFAKLGKWADASENFKKMETTITTLPIELQRQVLIEAVRASIETHDFAVAANKLNDFDTLGVPKELEPRLAVLNGRVDEGLGHNEEALTAYRTAADSTDRVSAARGRLHDVSLRFQLGELKEPEVIDELETLTTFWRGDDTEVEALQLLARLYTEAGRYREAFHVMRTAFKAHPNSELTRRIQEEAAAAFDSLFLAGKGDAMPAIEALALFYDFRELTPVGRRGDEMIRRLTDRLVSVDLLDQAAELLQHQVDHRLQGAARAQVAARLAVVYLMDRKPEKALTALRTSRVSDVASELRNQRLLIEARALSEIGRHDMAIDVVSNLTGREAIRMRADAYWAAKRWREAAEQIELLYGDRWKEFEPLNDIERVDLLRAAIGYAIDDDQIGLGRFREKYGAKMMEGPDRRGFEVATSPLAATGDEFRDVVRQIASVDTLEGFLRELRARYPETGAFDEVPPVTAPPAPAGPKPPPGTSAQLRRSQQGSADPKSDPKSTGSIAADGAPARAATLRTVTR